jgi:hypothetical protein
MSNKTYDAFISYASADRAWADRLYTSLVQRGLKVFQDTRALRVGEGWEDQLDQAVVDARHLVCLWSAAAKASGWVTREVADFRAEQRRQRDDAGGLLMVPLDATPHPYTSLQQTKVRAVQQAFAQGVAGLAALPESVWNELVDPLDARLKLGKDALVLPIVPLTLTERTLAAIPELRLRDLAQRLGLDPTTLRARYGATRLDWQPFGDGRSLRALLQAVKAELDGRLAPLVAHWDLPGDDFWSEDDDRPALAFINAMKQQHLGAVLVDPIALLDAEVLNQLGRFQRGVNEESFAVIVPPPAAADARAQEFRRHLRLRGGTMLQEYFDPPKDHAALRLRVAVGADDPDELLRLVRQGLALRSGATAPGGRPAGPIDNTP